MILKFNWDNFNTQIAIKDTEITQITDERNEFERKFVISEEEAKKIVEKFTNLQLESNTQKQELEKQTKKITELKGLLGKSQEEVLNHKINVKEEKLENFIQQLSANREQVINLCNIYEELIRSRQDCNRSSVKEAESNVNIIKQKLLDAGVSVANMQKTCRKCEKLADLRLQREQIYQQQYHAHHEVSLHHC